MNKILVVARWEYIEKLRSKAFLIGLFLTPILMISFGILPGLFASHEAKEQTKTIGVIDLTGEMGVEFANRMRTSYKRENGTPNYVVENIPVPEGEELEAIRVADARVAADDIGGFVVIRSATTTDSTVEFRSTNIADYVLNGRIAETLRAIISERKLAAAGLSPSLLKDINAGVSVRTVRLSTSGGEAEETGVLAIFFKAYIFLMMLFFLILTSGQLLVRSLMEEKSSRIVEVLVSSCSSNELMMGKVLGLAALGFTQIGFWTAVGLGISTRFDVALVSLDQAVLLLIYFVLGYLLYAGVFIGLGSPVSTEQEAQQLTSYLVLLLVLPIVVTFPALQNPDATWLIVMSYIPLLTPTVMALRISIQMPGTWEILATITLLLVSVVAAMWVAGRIFRVAILATGKRPRLVEIVRWVKMG